MKFIIPLGPAQQILLHEEMLQRVEMALDQTSVRLERLSAEIQAKAAANERYVELHQAHKEVRVQLLCLQDQQKRLQEGIKCLQTGC
ncbi:MAG: hypothetical protein A4E48_00992 [Methanosaeta sp. PtaU1.Bin060]|jgi:hypothetical protein|nr:MAG: hypothetical protein A4E48_00992 [Methanosaeta sp. PtaU1.Bin060]